MRKVDDVLVRIPFSLPVHSSSPALCPPIWPFRSMVVPPSSRFMALSIAFLPYSGCYVRASITFYPFNTNGLRGVACGLQNLQFWCDGEPLNGRVRAEDEFDALDDVDDEDFLD